MLTKPCGLSYAACMRMYEANGVDEQLQLKLHRFFHDDDDLGRRLSDGNYVARALRWGSKLPDQQEQQQAAAKELFDRYYQIWSRMMNSNESLHQTQYSVGDYFECIFGEPWAERNQNISSIFLGVVIPSIPHLHPHDTRTRGLVLNSSAVLLDFDCLVKAWTIDPELVLKSSQVHLQFSQLPVTNLWTEIRKQEDPAGVRGQRWNFVCEVLHSVAESMCGDVQLTSSRCTQYQNIIAHILPLYPAARWSDQFGRWFAECIASLKDRRLKALSTPSHRQWKNEPFTQYRKIHAVIRHHLAVEKVILRHYFRISGSARLQQMPSEVILEIGTYLFGEGYSYPRWFLRDFKWRVLLN